MNSNGRVFSWVTLTDRNLLQRARLLHRPWLTLVMRSLTTLGNGSTWAVTALALLLAGGSLAPIGLRIAVSALLAVAVSFPLKRLCCRARPSTAIAGYLPLARDPDRFSFPSGHTCAAFSVAVAVGPSVPMPLALSIAASIGFSRVYLGAHFPMDVLAGATMGSGLGLFARWLLI
jgi:undecaprenyl-diphosphatase